VNRKRIIVGVAVAWICLWLVPVVGPRIAHQVQVWRHGGVWCAKYSDDGRVKFYRYGLYCDPEWARQESSK
jgi:hypothetical protein